MSCPGQALNDSFCSRLCSGLFQLPPVDSGSRQKAACSLPFVVAPTGLGYCGNPESRFGAMEEPRAPPQPYLRLDLEVLRWVVAALHQSMGADSNSYGFPWEGVIWAATFGFFAVPFFLWRGFRYVRNQLYVGREKKLAETLSRLIEEKCTLLEKCSDIQKQHEGQEVESSLQDPSFEKVATEAQILEATCEKLSRSNVELEDEILRLVKELKEEKSTV
ncbi:cTAGE member 4 [Saguinus oedipus]|uniref:CTAGE member 4 n=1 Tax=Saguinus oedipus TaxID=9490 RepID=A0ABQ9UZE7_SAGOE|nr:cTAGE member 4 [Saguinus oedipus]